MRKVGCLSFIVHLRLARYYKSFSERLVIGSMAGKENEKLIEQLYAQIGQLKVENDFLKKKLK